SRKLCMEYDVLLLLRTPARLVEEIEAAFLHPVRPVGAADLVGRVEDGMRRLDDLHLRVLIGDALAADPGGIRTVLRVVELELVVLNDHGAAGFGVIDQA